MSKLALINDHHFGSKGDAEYMLDYQEKFYKNIFFPTLIKSGIDTILIGGDVFDRRKFINFRTLERTKTMFFDVASEYNIKMYIIAGNHDCFAKNTNDVNSIELLLNEYDNIEYIATPRTLTFDNTTIDMVPWINTENYDATMEFITTSVSDILYGHLELTGFEMYAGVKSIHGMSPQIFKKFSRVWSGHYHHKSQSGNISYLGAPMEFTFADSGDARGFHIFDTTKNKLTFIRNTYTLYDKIYYNDEDKESQEFYRTVDTSIYSNKIIKMYVVRKTAPALFEHFVDRIYAENDINITIHEDHSEFAEDNICDDDVKDQSTKDLMDAYVDAAETDMDKSRIKNILNTIYVEALNTGAAGNL